MNPQVSGGATDATEEVQEQSQGQPTLLEAVLQDMGKAPEEKPEAEKKEPEPEVTETESESEEVEETKEEQEQEEPSKEEEELKPAAEKDDQWPESAKRRVKEEADKRRARTQELETLKSEKAQIETQLKQVQAQLQTLSNRQYVPTPTPAEPLADIVDPQGLAEAERQAEQMIAFCEEYRDGAEKGTVVGKGADGKEQTLNRDLSPKEITDLKLHYDRILRRAIPQKIAYLQQLPVSFEEAKKICPEMANDSSDEARFGASVIAAFPSIRSHPEWPVFMAWMLEGRKRDLASRNGDKPQKPVSEAAKKILEAPKIKPAPSTIKTRAVPEQTLDIETARKNLKEQGSDDAMEAFVAATLAKGNRGQGKELVAA